MPMKKFFTTFITPITPDDMLLAIAPYSGRILSVTKAMIVGEIVYPSVQYVLDPRHARHPEIEPVLETFHARRQKLDDLHDAVYETGYIITVYRRLSP